jgi:hypothetical protein
LGSESSVNNHQFTGQDTTLRALAFELKNPLINIARHAELADKNAASKIQHTAEQALMLIDSYLLHAQTEYGQTTLDLSPTIMGSVLYDVSWQMRTQASLHNTEIIIDDRAHEPVMTHRQALTSVLQVFGDTLLGIGESNRRQQIILRGYKTRTGKLGIGMFTEAKISQTDLSRALLLQGRAYMPLSQLNNNSNASLAIADGLCRAIGGEMTVKHMGKLSGLATELPRSEQLAFV